MPERRPKPYGFNFLNTLSQKIGDLSGFVPMCRELIQNADDEECEWISFEFGLYLGKTLWKYFGTQAKKR